VMMTFVNSSYTKVRPTPLVVAPGKAIAAQLNYRIVDCGSVLPSPGVPAQTLRISFRDSAGALHAQTLPLGSARIRLRTPMPADCATGVRRYTQRPVPRNSRSPWQQLPHVRHLALHHAPPLTAVHGPGPSASTRGATNITHKE
jgi:hypothetical protein